MYLKEELKDMFISPVTKSAVGSLGKAVVLGAAFTLGAVMETDTEHVFYPERASEMCNNLAQGQGLTADIKDPDHFLSEPSVGDLVEKCENERPRLAINEGCVVQGLRKTIGNGVKSVSIGIAEDIFLKESGGGVNMCQ